MVTPYLDLLAPPYGKLTGATFLHYTHAHCWLSCSHFLWVCTQFSAPSASNSLIGTSPGKVTLDQVICCDQVIKWCWTFQEHPTIPGMSWFQGWVAITCIMVTGIQVIGYPKNSQHSPVGSHLTAWHIYISLFMVNSLCLLATYHMVIYTPLNPIKSPLNHLKPY